MKAVVMEVKDGYAAVLSEDGQFIKVKDDGYQPGMELSLKKTEQKKSPAGRKANSANKKSRVILGQFRAFAAAAAAAICLIVGMNLYYTPYAVISLDVNPSIEITVNRFGRVLGVEAVNGDGTELADTLVASGVKNQSYDTAVDMALGYVAEGNYAADDGKVYVVLSASADDEAYSEKVTEDLATRTASYENMSAEVVKATKEEAAEAKELGTTAGKVHIVNQLQAKEPEIEKKEWIKRPVKDIVNEIKKEKPEEKKEPEAKEKPEETKETETREKPEETKETETREKPEETKETEAREKPEEPKETEARKKSEELKETEAKEKSEETKETGVREKPEETRETEIREKPEETKETEIREKPEETKETEAKEKPELPGKKKGREGQSSMTHD